MNGRRFHQLPAVSPAAGGFRSIPRFPELPQVPQPSPAIPSHPQRGGRFRRFHDRSVSFLGEIDGNTMSTIHRAPRPVESGRVVSRKRVARPSSSVRAGRASPSGARVGFRCMPSGRPETPDGRRTGSDRLKPPDTAHPQVSGRYPSHPQPSRAIPSRVWTKALKLQLRVGFSSAFHGLKRS